jgi:DNA-binding transcriptional LysR family regulator
MVNLEWYRTFKAVYTTGTLTGAAEALFISQPGVSLHLGALENYVGYKLFDRTGRKMVPTERGKVLFNVVAEPIAKLEEAEKTFQRSTEKNTPTISIGMCFETFQTSLEQYIGSLPFNVIICFGEYPEMLENLDKGILDLIVTQHKSTSAGIVNEAFSQENIVLVGGVQESIDAFKILLRENDNAAAEAWLKNHKWYGTTNDMEHLFRFWEHNFNHRPGFRPNYIVPNIHSIVRCLSGGKGLAVVPDFLCINEIKEGKLQVVWEGTTKLTNTLYFGCRKNTNYATEIEHLKGLFRKVMPLAG